jgi:Cdc6-like AAA superfamily ATPase
MMSDTIKVKKLTLLEHIEKIVEMSEKNGFGDVFFKDAEPHLAFVTETLCLTPIQAALFAHFLNKSDDETICVGEIAKSIKCKQVKLIQYMNDIDELENKKLLCCRRNRTTTYRVPMEVINALRKNEEFVPLSNKNISIDEFFSVLESLFDQRDNDELTFTNLSTAIKDLIEDNMQLVFSQKITSYKFSDYNLLLLVCFCHLFVNNHDDNVGFHDIEFLYDDRRQSRNVLREFKTGSHVLMDAKFIENTNSDGFVNKESFQLTDKAKQELLAEVNLSERQVNMKRGLLLFESLPAKRMFYNEAESGKIQELTSLLQESNFKNVQGRLSSNGMRTGFACLFSGAPGTGKTETVYQIAKETGRNIMQVDISATKSMWFGESEKQIKEIFDRYKAAVEKSETLPILLFNEADAVISKRIEVTTSTVAQTENAIQNIILQEIENLTGILIATTNLTKNMDKAFERRFLYKIEFKKPDIVIRKSIWQSIIPNLSDADAKELSSRFDFSGGQIENVARKRTVDAVVSGAEPSLERLVAFCKDELFNNDVAIRIGF